VIVGRDDCVTAEGGPLNGAKEATRKLGVRVALGRLLLLGRSTRLAQKSLPKS
jgi:hypothetical protein